MTDFTAHLAEIERLGEQANASPAEPDWEAILRHVAEEAGVSYEDLRAAWLDSFIMGAN